MDKRTGVVTLGLRETATRLSDRGLYIEVKLKRLGRRTVEGESPVNESMYVIAAVIPSSVGHEESCVKLGGPPSKAKYSS